VVAAFALPELPADLKGRLKSYPAAGGEILRWRDKTELRDEQVCFQAGVQLPGGEVLYEPWTCVPISAAAVWVETGGDVDGM
jgi:hypothetical protein